MPATAPAAQFNGLRVAAFESRRRDEMSRLIANLGGKAVVAPSMREVPIEENRDAFEFWEQLKAGKIGLLILFTGVGTGTLLKVLTSKNSVDDVTAALKKIPILARGPKPVRALSEAGLKPTITVPEPNTWREILKTLDAQKNIDGLTVAVQEYGEPNRLFLSELAARGARVLPVRVYRAALPEDTRPLMDLIRDVIAGRIEVLLFTNSMQVENALSVARSAGLAESFRRASLKAVVASIGPTCTETLRNHGFVVDLEPKKPMMGVLVAETASQSASVLERKKAGGTVEITSAGVAKPGDALHESLFMKACRREPTSRTPVWLMRQAGRYMKEYRELRAKVSFLKLCMNSDLASEVTVDAAHRLGVDAAIIFSDLLLLVQPLGFELTYEKDEGPAIRNPFRSSADLKRVKPVNVEESMSYVFEAIRKTRRALKSDLPLIGFAGAPFTMASYMIEGKGSKNFVATKSLMYREPQAWHAFLGKIVDATIDYLNAQVAAGAQAVQIFDSWVGCLSPEDYRAFVLPHSKRLTSGIQPGVPVITFGTQTAGLLPLFREAGGDVIGVDWRVELDEAWAALGDVAIQGNMDPVALFADKKEIRSQAQRILNQAGGRPGHIFNLGHGILPETPLENVLALVEAVKDLSHK